MTITYKDWHEMLPFALHGYRTSIRTSTWTTLVYMVYGMDTVLLIKVEVASPQDNQRSKTRRRLVDMSEIREIKSHRKEKVDCVVQRTTLAEENDSCIRQKNSTLLFSGRRFCLKKDTVIFLKKSQRKVTPNYEGPYIVKKAFSGRALILTSMLLLLLLLLLVLLLRFRVCLILSLVTSNIGIMRGKIRHQF